MQTKPEYGETVVKSYIKQGMLASVTITTKPLHFAYSYYEDDKAVNLYILRRFNEMHKRLVLAYVPPEDAERLIEAFFTPPKTEETEETWKHIYAMVETMTTNITKVATAKVGDDLTTKGRGLAVAFGYRQEYPDKYYVYADAEWAQEKYSCRVYESDYVDAQDIRQSLMYFVGNVLDLVKICTKS